MPKYIDPDLLTRELERRKLSTGRLIQWQAAMEAATVEVPDIVMCKSCKHRLVADNGKIYCDEYMIYVTDDHFCTHSERREDSGEGASE